MSSTILATLALHAFDGRFQPMSMLASALLGGMEEHTGPCPSDMVLVTQALVPFCVDRYEASASSNCPFPDPQSGEQTALNMASPNCRAVTQSGRPPWTQVSQVEATAACSKSGKRLLTAGEWHKAALGTPDMVMGTVEDTCNTMRNIEDGAALSGSAMRCVSDSGAYDMIGNVWEWVDEQVAFGAWEGRTLPQSGYVAGVDQRGVAYETGSAVRTEYGNDRFWVDHGIQAGIMRGGYFDSGDDAGLHSVYAASPPSFSGEAVGFRCAVTSSRGGMN